MEYLYIDESGSMTSRHTNTHPYFVIALVRTENPEKLKRLHKRFVKAHMDELMEADAHAGRMFRNGRFDELKGSSFTPDLKREFVSYFCRENTLSVYYIVLDNKKIHANNGHLYDNTARAFNYSMRLALEYFINHGMMPDDEYFIQLDERNERTGSKHFLQTYLNTEFRTRTVLSKDIQVKYFDSSKNRMIQLADVFANIYYSHLLTKAYSSEFEAMRDSKCLRFVFNFPL